MPLCRCQHWSFINAFAPEGMYFSKTLNHALSKGRLVQVTLRMTLNFWRQSWVYLVLPEDGAEDVVEDEPVNYEEEDKEGQDSEGLSKSGSDSGYLVTRFRLRSMSLLRAALGRNSNAMCS